LRLLISGACGFVGSHLTEKYVKEGHTVLALDNFLSGSLDNVKHLLDYSNFKLVKGDIRDKQLLKDLVDGVDVIFHLAAQIHVDRSYIEPELTYDINVNGTQNILELARLHDVKRVIHASSSEVYGTAQFVPMTEKHELLAPHPYGASKIAADRMCSAYQSTYGMDIVIMRPFNIFGQRQRDIGYGAVISLFTRRVLNNIPPMIYGDGEQRREYVFIDDIVRAYDMVFKHSGLVHEPVNFATGIDYSIKEIAEMIIETCGKDMKPVHVEKRMAEVQRLCGDATRAREIYGWTPLVSMKEGLEKFVKWYKIYGVDRHVN
jgi:UDP-glucose 4-epimerase